MQLNLSLNIKYLKRMDLISQLEFIFEASFHSIRPGSKEKVNEFVRMADVDSKVDNVTLEPFANTLKSMDERQLKMLAQRLAAETIQNPDNYRFLLLMALFKSP
jgi:hypothetical protein